jgi:hypothetical protein
VTSLQAADAMLAAVDPDWGGVLDTYAAAVEWSLQAVQQC